MNKKDYERAKKGDKNLAGADLSIKKDEDKQLILWHCRHCGALNLELLSWIRTPPNKTECVSCEAEFKVLMS